MKEEADLEIREAEFPVAVPFSSSVHSRFQRLARRVSRWTAVD